MMPVIRQDNPGMQHVRTAGFISVVLALALGLALGACRGPSADFSGADLVILAGTLVDVEEGALRHNAAVVIGGEIILAVLDLDDWEPPEGVPAIDARDGVVIPGLINAHVHSGAGFGPLWLFQGVTTVADLGTGLASLRAHQRAFQPQHSPHMLWAGPIIGPPGGYPAPVWGRGLAYEVEGPVDAAAKVAALLEEHDVDIVKIAVSSGLPAWPRLSVEETAAIVRTAHAHGKVVLAHVDRADDVRVALAGGVDALAHIPWERMPDDLLEQAVREDLIIVPTLNVLLAVMPERSRDILDNVRRFHSMGGVLALGDDVPGARLRPGLPEQEMMRLHEDVGMDLLEILRIATINAARALGIDDVTGSIAAGKRADMVILDGELRAVQDLRNIRHVLKSGAQAWSASE